MLPGSGVWQGSQPLDLRLWSVQLWRQVPSAETPLLLLTNSRQRRPLQPLLLPVLLRPQWCLMLHVLWV